MFFSRPADRVSAQVAAGLVLASLILVLVLPGDVLLTGRTTDMVNEFVAWRAFLAESLQHGRIPLWNPWTYGGQPFLGNFESAVLYPPSLLFLILPLAQALNFSLLLHLILLGWGMERWARWRGFQPAAATVAGLVLPLSGPVFPHLYAGHLSNISTMAWAPLVFLGLEMWYRDGVRKGLFLASAAICLQLLAGHVQYVFYTAVAAGVQALFLTVAQPPARHRILPGLAVAYVAAVVLGAAQLLPGLAASSEGIRQRSLDYNFAAMFGFPPENVLTLIAPGFFGTLIEPGLFDQAGTLVYWGRCYFWEMSLFLGAISPLLIALALMNGKETRRPVLLDLAVAAALFVIALGVHTPAFNLFYYFVPGFGHFRSWSKFIFPVALFLIMAMTAGLDALLRGRPVPRILAWSGLGTGGLVVLVGGALVIAPNLLAPLFHGVQTTRESYLPAEYFGRADTLATAGFHAGLSLLLAGAVLAGAALALFFSPRRPVLRWVLPGLLVLEMIGAVAGEIPQAHLSDAAPPELKKFITEHPGNQRVLNVAHANNGFLLGAGDLDGNNPSVLRRYAEFIALTQGTDPDHATQYLGFRQFHPLLSLLRLRYIFIPLQDGSFHVVENQFAPLPHLLLVSDWQLPGSREAMFSALRATSFQPDRTALLEEEPSPRPVAGATGSARVLSDEGSALTIDATVDRPMLLLITDHYSSAWYATPLPGSVQSSYRVLPADYTLRAIPLAAGHHLLRLAYAPVAFPVGVMISLLAWAGWLAALIWWREPARRAEAPPAEKRKSRRGRGYNR